MMVIEDERKFKWYGYISLNGILKNNDLICAMVYAKVDGINGVMDCKDNERFKWYR